MHTGAVLAGILGQRQWQYDVYSKDVELANKMESSGMAGYDWLRFYSFFLFCNLSELSILIWLIICFIFLSSRVHISERTLNFLNGEFEVEPAFGEKREEMLRIAGIKTYYIKKVLKPVS